MTTALEGGEGSASHPGSSLPSGKTRYPFYRRVGGPQGRSGLVSLNRPRKNCHFTVGISRKTLLGGVSIDRLFEDANICESFCLLYDHTL